MTLQDLKNAGYRTYVSHLRHFQMKDSGVDDNGVHYEFTYNYPLMTKGQAYDEFDLDGEFILPRGGVSKISVYKGDELVAESSTKCSKNDMFNRKRAISILLGRIAKQLQL